MGHWGLNPVVLLQDKCPPCCHCALDSCLAELAPARCPSESLEACTAQPCGVISLTRSALRPFASLLAVGLCSSGMSARRPDCAGRFSAPASGAKDPYSDPTAFRRGWDHPPEVVLAACRLGL